MRRLGEGDGGSRIQEEVTQRDTESGRKEAKATEDSRKGSDKDSVDRVKDGSVPRSPKIHRDKTHELQRVLDGKKAGLKKNYRSHQGDHDRVLGAE